MTTPICSDLNQTPSHIMYTHTYTSILKSNNRANLYRKYSKTGSESNNRSHIHHVGRGVRRRAGIWTRGIATLIDKNVSRFCLQRPTQTTLARRAHITLKERNTVFERHYGKEGSIYIAPLSMQCTHTHKVLRLGSHSFTCKQHHACLSFVSVHQMALPQLRQQTPNCSLPLTYWPRKDERLSWPGWLIYSGLFSYISGHPSATGRAQDKESSPAKDWCSTVVLRDRAYLTSGWTAWITDCSALTPVGCRPSAHPQCNQGYFNLN